MKQVGDFREYYIVFTGQARLNWFYRLFTRPGFRHCEIYVSVTDDVSMGICQTLENVEYTYYAEPIKTVISKLKAKDATILYLPLFKKPRNLRLGILVPSCVGHCMIITGLSFNVLGVYDYYKRLLKHGAAKL